MAYGLMRGTAMDEERPGKKLLENVIETIGASFDSPDENVQLQIIKVFTISKLYKFFSFAQSLNFTHLTNILYHTH